MKIEVDTHTHSIASLHAYSTLAELVKGAKKSRLKGFVLSEHGPALQGGLPHPYYFGNLRVLPEKIGGIRVFRGVEANIVDEAGNVDLSTRYLRNLDLVMAGLHEACFPPGNAEANTRALLNTIANPYIDGITHPGNPVFTCDIERVVQAAVQYGKFLEINNSSFRWRAGSDDTCFTVAKYAKLHGCFLTVASDAHYWSDVGNFKIAQMLVDTVHIHPDQIVNCSFKRFSLYVERRKAQRHEIL